MKTDYTADAIKWLNKALYKPYKREMLSDRKEQITHLHIKNGKTIGCNGTVMFIVHAKLPVESSKEFPDWKAVYKSAVKGSITGEFSKWHLEKAAKVLGVFARESANILRLSLNGSISASAKSAESGDGQVEISNGDEWVARYAFDNAKKAIRGLSSTERFDHGVIYNRAVYSHRGNDVKFGINYKLLLDALSGMPDVMQYRMTDSNSPIVLSGEVGGVLREAIVMPMYIREWQDD